MASNPSYYDFTGSVPKDVGYHCVSSKHAYINDMNIGSINDNGDRELAAAIESAEENSQDTLDQILDIVKTIDDNTQPQGRILTQTFRSYDGSANNVNHPKWGKAHENQIRESNADYDPNTETAVRGASNPNPRIISNSICKGISLPSTNQMSDMAWVWGQFLDHEIALTPTQNENSEKYPIPETLNIITPTVQEDPNEDYPSRTIPFTRSAYENIQGTRQQSNDISAFIDATNVYGCCVERAYALRCLDGTGKMKTTLANNSEYLPPKNDEGLPNAAPAGTTPSDFYLCGDIRSNEHALLTAMHTLFIREHNRLCDVIAAQNNGALSGKEELIYQKARRYISGMMQWITYNEFLPALIGDARVSQMLSLPYNPLVDATVAIEFSTVGYRIGHTMVSSNLAVGPQGSSSVALKDVFFTPEYVQQNGCDALLVGATKQLSQEIDGVIVEDLRSFLFGPPTSSLMHDLASLNVQRGRDHGIAGYNDVRQAYGLSRITSFGEIPTDVANQNKLEALYDSVDDIDPWIGGIIESHAASSATGPLFTEIIRKQFEKFKMADSFWFENDPIFAADEIAVIKQTTLKDVLVRNTQYSGDQFQTNVFLL